MQIINDNTVVVNDNDELKQVLSEENNYNYVYLGNDITVTSGFVINNKKSNDTVTRTIRISKKVFDKINSIAEEENISFNNVINQIIMYGIDNLE